MYSISFCLCRTLATSILKEDDAYKLHFLLYLYCECSQNTRMCDIVCVCACVRRWYLTTREIQYTVMNRWRWKMPPSNTTSFSHQLAVIYMHSLVNRSLSNFVFEWIYSPRDVVKRNFIIGKCVRHSVVYAIRQRDVSFLTPNFAIVNLRVYLERVR